ncbi:MAG: phage integrase N-terminal SAM-like domain-containing protein [Planctomycetes bacterium]|nr:phage integrase N-terminal SAM-like domain-containing protein [Planctomycetota bacterium]MBL7008877.1 phage integrase N-terminal SAM-like domain-containing protein [Planctomycetota bacterium]
MPHLWRHANGTFYLVWQEGGGTKRRSAGTDKRVQAEKHLRAFLEEWERRRWGRSEELTVTAAAKEWVGEKARPRHGLSPSTVRQYRVLADRLIAFLPDGMRVVEVTPRDLRRFLDHLEKKHNLSTQGIRKRLSLLSMFVP